MVEFGAITFIRHLCMKFPCNNGAPKNATMCPPDLSTWPERNPMRNSSARFRLLPDHYPDRLRCRGRFTITDQPGGSRRVVAGELQVKAPLVGGRVEQAIVSGLEEYLEAEAPVVDAWIRGSG